MTVTIGSAMAFPTLPARAAEVAAIAIVAITDPT